MNTSSIKTRFAAFAALLCITTSAFAAMPKTGDAFPDLSKFGLEGTLPETKGKVVIVDFFASWCEPCKESFPAMEELKQKYGDRLVIIAVNVDKKKADMDEFLKKHPATFSIVRDASNKLVGELKIPTMPSSFVLDQAGKVHSFHRGFKGGETTKKYAQEIDALLK